jgi:hypothetical protein
MRKRNARASRKKAGGKQDRTSPRRKSRALTETTGSRHLAKRPTSTEGGKTVIDPLTGDLPAVTLKDSHEVLLHFERVDPRLAEAWRRDVVVHEGPITLRRIMSPANFGGATHYAYVDRRLLWYLRHDSSNPVGARWEGYLTRISDAPPDTIVVFVGRDILAKKCPPQLDDGTPTKKLDAAPPTSEVSSAVRDEEQEACNGRCIDDAT